MSIVELGALGEFLGVFALVATLIYLSIQARHAKKQLERAAADSRSTGVREGLTALAASDTLSAAWCRAHDVLGVPLLPVSAELVSRGLDAQDAVRMHSWWMARYMADGSEFEASKDKAEHNSKLLGSYRGGIGRVFWDAGPKDFGLPFTNYVNLLLAEADEPNEA